LGVLLGLLHIAHRGRAGRFFCSQFVAAVLQKSEAATLKKDSSIYLPKDLKDLPGMREVFCGNARDLLRHNESATMPWQVD
jgi:hypothetical protein